MKAKPQISNPPASFDHKRDAYGFAVRPQHVQRYREYANIYREEEEERSDRWKNFLQRQSEDAPLPINGSSALEHKAGLVDGSSNKIQVGDDGLKEPEAEALEDEASSRTHRAQIWAQIRPSLRAIKDMMNARVKKKNSATKTEKSTGVEEDSEDEFYDMERSESDPSSEVLSTEGSADVSLESSIPWKQELEFLVQGGVPMAVRGEFWQAFVGVKARHVKNYYQNLLLRDSKKDNGVDHQRSDVDEANNNPTTDSVHLPEKWKLQIEKDLPRTFPGHPVLDEGGRNALRRILTTYARHNPSVGYCQAMNFFAALLLLLMPEENAFWALLGILDDYFEGYFSEEMIESQVDQLVFEELVRERFPKLGCFGILYSNPKSIDQTQQNGFYNKHWYVDSNRLSSRCYYALRDGRMSRCECCDFPDVLREGVQYYAFVLLKRKSESSSLFLRGSCTVLPTQSPHLSC